MPKSHPIMETKSQFETYLLCENRPMLEKDYIFLSVI